jgi:hypothetical protein
MEMGWSHAPAMQECEEDLQARGKEGEREGREKRRVLPRDDLSTRSPVNHIVLVFYYCY